MLQSMGLQTVRQYGATELDWLNSQRRNNVNIYIHDEQINQMWPIGIMEYHSAMEGNGVPTQGATWMHLVKTS